MKFLVDLFFCLFLLFGFSKVNCVLASVVNFESFYEALDRRIGRVTWNYHSLLGFKAAKITTGDLRE